MLADAHRIPPDLQILIEQDKLHDGLIQLETLPGFDAAPFALHACGNLVKLGSAIAAVSRPAIGQSSLDVATWLSSAI